MELTKFSFLLKTVLTLLLLSTILGVNGQEKKKNYEVVCVGFYNLENLFDTIDNDNRDDEYLPESAKSWGTKRYNEKLDNMAEVISQIAIDVTPEGPAVLGVSEIENRGVLEDLAKTDALKDRNYKVVHFDSPDKRGVDVGLLYQPKYFTVTGKKSYLLDIGDTSFYSRDQLLVSGLMNGEKMHFIVNHWPSRRGGETKSRPKRIAAAELSRHIADSLIADDKNAKVIIMGDLNDTPNDVSVTKYLKATDDKKLLKKGYFFNPMQTKEKNGEGSHAYRDNWSMLDQLILTPGLVDVKNRKTYTFYQARIFKKDFMLNPQGSFKGYPLRSFVGNSWQGGYSDHFPVYVLLIRETKK